jgi:hypothetical protein
MNPYEPPRSSVARATPTLPGPLRLLVYTELSLKALQLTASLWLLMRGMNVVWSLLDVALHATAGFLLLNGRRIALVPLLLVLPLGVMVSLRDGAIVPARAVFLMGLPIVIALLVVRHWRAISPRDGTLA